MFVFLKHDGQLASRRQMAQCTEGKLSLNPGLIFVFVFFPTNVADLAGPPARQPVTDVGYGMIRTAPHTIRLGGDFEVFDNGFRHFRPLLLDQVS